jgi:GT2 family glycosyltransferase
VIYLVTVNYYSISLITRLITSLSPNQSIPHKIVIVNNSLEDRTVEELDSEIIQIIEAKTNLGFGKACNLALNWIYSQDSQALVWLINPDAYLLADSLVQASQFFLANPEVSILGTEVYEPTGKIWFGWGQFVKQTGKIVVVKQPLLKTDKPYFSTDWVTGCSLLINLKNFKKCPQFDPDYFLYYEDFDFSRRYADRGHLVVVTNQIKVIHEPSSITERYGYLKLKHNIYSYLLSLEKHTNHWVLWTRFIRMILMSLIVLPFKPKFAISKLEGVLMYCRRFIQLQATKS